MSTRTRFGLALLVVALAASPGCGQSAQQKAAASARDEVCSAAANISRRLAALDALSASQLNPRAAVSDAMTIGVNLRRVRMALPDLDAAKADELRAAEARFQEEFGSVVSGLVGGVTLEAKDVERDLVPALDELHRRWRATLGQATEAWCP